MAIDLTVQKDGTWEFTVPKSAEKPDKDTDTEDSELERAGFQTVFKEWGPAVGGGALAVGVSELADGLFGNLGQIGGGVLGVNLGRVLPKVAAAWVIHTWARRQFPSVSKYAVAFLLYDATKEVLPIDRLVRDAVRGFGFRRGPGNPNPVGALAPAPSSQIASSPIVDRLALLGG